MINQNHKELCRGKKKNTLRKKSVFHRPHNLRLEMFVVKSWWYAKSEWTDRIRLSIAPNFYGQETSELNHREKNPEFFRDCVRANVHFIGSSRNEKGRIIMTNRWTARLEEGRNRPLNMIHYISEVSPTSGSKTDWCDWSPSTIV